MTAAPAPTINARIEAVKARGGLADLVGRRLKLKRSGPEFTAPCPFHDEKTPSFTVVPDKGFAHCFGCGWHGDALAFVQAADGLGFVDALQKVEGELGLAGSSASALPARISPVKLRESRKRIDESWIDSGAAGRIVWNGAARSSGSLVEAYLRHRGIDPAASGVLGVVRYHPACPTRLWRRWESPGDARDICPAMLAPICRLEGAAGARRWIQQGVHITYLAADGRGKKRFAPWRGRDGKDRVPPSRKIWGTLDGGAVPIAPALWADWQDAEWLGADMALPLVVAEGLESTLSLMTRLPSVRGACATLSLGNLQGGWLEGRSGALEMHNLRPDAARRPFAVPDAGAVAIGVDADMKGLKNRKVQDRLRGPVVRRDLTGAERSTLCGVVAAAHWRSVGGGPVKVLRPAMGCDFNDEIMRSGQ